MISPTIRLVYKGKHLKLKSMPWDSSHAWRINGILASRSGQDIEVVARDTDRDNFMSAQDAVEYGLIDEVLTREPVESK